MSKRGVQEFSENLAATMPSGTDSANLTSTGTGTLGKAMDVLETVSLSDKPLRFTDLLERVDQPRGTLHRQLTNLIDEGLLELGPDQSYQLGLRLLHFASKAWSKNEFRQISEPHLRALHKATGETVHLGVLQGTNVIYVDKVESQQAVRMHSQIGNASPSYCTGVGKAALSALDLKDAEARIQTLSFHQFTPTTLMSAEALLAEMALTRKTGLAFDREEHETGIHCVAAPIFSNDRRFVAGLSVTAPCYRVSMDQLMQWSGDIKDAANAITADLDIRMGPRRG